MRNELIVSRFSVQATLLLAVGLAFAVECRAENQPSSGINSQPVVFEEIPFATIKRDSRWPKREIQVCWENGAPTTQSMQEIVRESVRETWESASQIRFVGWSDCTTNSRGIRILISDERPHTKALGSFLNGMPNGMVLNLSYNEWRPSCKKNYNFCIKAISVHEFGHALGFAHEHNRLDAISKTPPECRREEEDPSLQGDWNLTGYDWSSIMNYCNTQWLGNGLLSDRDKMAVSFLYGSVL